ncbi:hypothetical protein DQ04_07621010 [Trypanosoma grayi]|uniref:hypothetical protein n=1 Tax=Trypanosoma grayi TaxID=71804 RepID=UPI0004F46D18|nr:hypothetical protein DQ04_07621010 [Trypanosoma grayi]KEG08251.1 hypothetical protein DQ04_07621010 [Trypanosoma grayi]
MNTLLTFVLCGCVFLVIALWGAIIGWLYMRKLRRVQKQRELLRQCPQAEPFEPPVPFPEVVEASVVFSGHQEAQRCAEEGGFVLTRVRSEMLTANSTLSLDHLGIGEAAEDGNHVPHAQTPSLLRGVPVNRRRLSVPNVAVEDCGVRPPVGLMYRLRRASTVYGCAEYISRGVGSTTRVEVA